MPKKTTLGICLLASLVTSSACTHGGRARAPVTIAANADDRATPAPDAASDRFAPRKEIAFDREFDVVDFSDNGERACTFVASNGFSYDGLLHFKGRPFARSDAFGKITGGSFFAEENRLYAPGAFYTDHAYVMAELDLPRVSLYASGPIVHDDWIHITRTRIATKSSVKGAFFAPDVKLPPNVRMKAPLREDAYRIPCGLVSPNLPENAPALFNGGSVSLNAPDKIVSVSRTPDGPAVAEIVHPSDFGVELLGMYKTTALVSISVSTRESDVVLVGWIHDGTLDDGGYGGQGFGNGGSVDHKDRAHLKCGQVPVFVTIEKKLYRLVDVNDSMDFYGVRREDGDFRVDLGADSNASSDKTSKDAPKALEPFIPKEYLPLCEEAQNVP